MQKGKTQIATEYVKKYVDLALKHNRSYSKREIGKIMFLENPDLFKDEEDGRLFIRNATNCHGEDVKKHRDTKEMFALISSPISENQDTSPFTFPTSVNKILAIADLHDRFYNKRAFEIAVNRAVADGCNGVLIDGDLFDFYQHSKFDKTPRINSLMGVEDIKEWAVDILELLQNLFGYVVIKKGNHDYHRERRIMQLAMSMPELESYASFEDFIAFNGSNVKVVSETNHVKIGKLNAIHGHEYYGGGGIHVAYNRLNKAFDNVMSAHSHKAQSVIRVDINGNIFGSWSLSCMCGLNPRFCPKNDWTNGFARINTFDGGDFEVQNMVIYGDRVFTI